jgi:hypothetical protein
VICGDINVQCRKSAQEGSDSAEYLKMMEILRNGLGARGHVIRDLAKEIDGKNHPVTYGEAHVDKFGRMMIRETSLTDLEHLKKDVQNTNQSFDKILWIPAADTTIVPVKTEINPLMIESKWKIEGSQHLTHLSDHYGIQTEIKIESLNESYSPTS